MDILTVIRRNPFAFPAACVATAAMVFVSEGSYRESVQSLDEAVRITSIRGSIQALAQGVLDAESGQRGYLLTDRKEYLEPYGDARRQIDEAFTNATNQINRTLLEVIEELARDQNIQLVVRREAILYQQAVFDLTEAAGESLNQRLPSVLVNLPDP